MESEKETKKDRSILFLVWVFIIVIAFIISISLNAGQKTTSNEANSNEKEVSRVRAVIPGDYEYSKIQHGMTVEEVNDIMGFEGKFLGESTEDGIHYESYLWEIEHDKDGTPTVVISADFENGLVVLKGGYNERDGTYNEHESYKPTNEQNE